MLRTRTEVNAVRTQYEHSTNAVRTRIVVKMFSFGYLSGPQALEDSGSAVREQGWLPQHLLMYDEKDEDKSELLGCVPLYLKSHSQGEYVFDHAVCISP